MKPCNPIYGENYAHHWPFKIMGRKILDLGADYGSTAYYFLKNGAESVVAVESDKALYDKLLENIDGDTRVKPVFLKISTVDDMYRLLSGPEDVIKADIEGAEEVFLNIPNHILVMKREWIIESHSSTLKRALFVKFIGAGFYLVREPFMAVDNPEIEVCHYSLL